MITLDDINFLVELANRLHRLQPLSTPEWRELNKIVKAVNDNLQEQQEQAENSKMSEEE